MKHIKLFEDFNEVSHEKVKSDDKFKDFNKLKNFLTDFYKANTEDAKKLIDSFISEGNDINAEGNYLTRDIARTGYNNIEVLEYLFDNGLTVSEKNYMSLKWIFEWSLKEDRENDNVVDLFLSNCDDLEILNFCLNKYTAETVHGFKNPRHEDYKNLIEKRIKELN
jgi:hypothetical protein